MTYLGTYDIPLSKLRIYPGNPRTGNIEAIKESLTANDQYRSIIVRADNPEAPEQGGTVLAGNHTFRAAGELDWTTIRCELHDVNDERAKKINLVDNRTPELGGFDEKLLAESLIDVEDLTGTGYNDTDLDGLIRSADTYGSQVAGLFSHADPPPTPVEFTGSGEGAGEEEGSESNSAAAQPEPVATSAVPSQNYTPPPEPKPTPAPPAPTGPEDPTPTSRIAGGAVTAYAQVSWAVTVDERSTVRAAIRAAQAKFAAPTSAQALVALCQDFLDRHSGQDEDEGEGEGVDVD